MPSTNSIERILIAEDEPEVRDYLKLSLQCRGYAVEHAENGNEVLSVLKGPGAPISLLLLDIMMPCKDGLETLREIRQFDNDLPIIMLSGVSSLSTIVETMRCGANDYLAKPVSHEQLLGAVQRTLSTPHALRPPARSALRAVPASRSAEETWMSKIEALIRQVGVSDAPVLLQGETGAGKEVLARKLHSASSRATHPFLKVNCAALPSELVESELFGYERGAFTGAFKSKPGKFDLADGGTIFLDEIGDMDFRLQAKLLQVLQDQEFQRLGGSETIRVNVRVMAATHADLEKSIREGRFREDLYYRLNVINIQVPSLRDRRNEIMPLAEFFMKKHATAASPALEIGAILRDAFLNYHWPGNIRELENVTRKYMVLQDAQNVIEELRLKSQRRAEPNAPGPSTTSAVTPGPSSSAPTLDKLTADQKHAETDAILTALGRTRWNRKQAAALLEVDYKALLYKMKKLGIDQKPMEAPQLKARAKASGI